MTKLRTRWKYLFVTLIVIAGLFYFLYLNNQYITLSGLHILFLVAIVFVAGYFIKPEGGADIELDRAKGKIDELTQEINLLKKEITSRDSRIEAIGKLASEVQEFNDMSEMDDVSELFNRIRELNERIYDIGGE